MKPTWPDLGPEKEWPSPGARDGPRGKQPKLSPSQEAHLVELYRAGGLTISELEELFSVTYSTIYRAVGRADACEA